MPVQRDRPFVDKPDDIRVGLGPTGPAPGAQMSREAFSEVADELAIRRDAPAAQQTASTSAVSSDPVSKDDAKEIIEQMMARPKQILDLKNSLLLVGDDLDKLTKGTATAKTLFLTEDEKKPLRSPIINLIKDAILHNSATNTPYIFQVIADAVTTFDLSQNDAFKNAMNGVVMAYLSGNSLTIRAVEASKYLDAPQKVDLQPDVAALLKAKLDEYIWTDTKVKVYKPFMNAFGISAQDLEPELTTAVKKGFSNQPMEKVAFVISEFGLDIDLFSSSIRNFISGKGAEETMEMISKLGVDASKFTEHAIRRIPRFAFNDTDVLATYVAMFKVTPEDLRKALESAAR